MTSPRHMPQFGTWSVPNCQLIIEYDLEILEAARREVTAGFEMDGGLEVAGVLLGSFDGERVRITGMLPIQCEHSFGPVFALSENDTARLDAQLRAYDDRSASGEIVVGWYQSHVRRGLALSAEDIKIYDGHFPQPWQVALLLRPAPGGTVHARFFLRESGTALQPQPAATAGGKPAPNRAQDNRGIRERRIPTAPLVETPSEPVAPPLPKPPSIHVPVENLAEPARAIRADARSRGIQSMAVWSVLAVMFVLAVASVFYLRFHFPLMPRTPGIVQMEAGIRDGGLEVRWDPKALGDVRQGRLEVRDGALLQQFPLDRETLIYGRFTCWPKSDVTNLRLHVDRTDGGVLEGSTTYVGRGIPAAAVAQAVPPAPQPEPPALTSPLTQTQPTPSPVPATSAPVKIPPNPTVEDRKPVVPPPVPAVSKPAPAATATVSAPAKQTPPTTNVASLPKQDESPKIRTEIPAPEPIQTAQVQRQIVPEIPVQAPPPPIQVQQSPAPRVTPQPVAAAPPPANQPQFNLAGHWVLQSGGYSRSPAVPEAVAITISDSDGGVHGVLEARYKSRSRPGRVHFSFSGKVTNGTARFGWTSSDGKPSQIEFIRIPNSPDVVEVVWQNPETKQVFDEMLRRAGR